MRTLPLLTLCACALILFPGSRTMDEGMWLPDSISKLPVMTMRTHGLELTPEQIFNEEGPSLKDAVVLLGGGTASFVSPDGLILTNHHVAHSSIQALSSVKDDYLKNGFWAHTRSEEQSTSSKGQVVVGMKDVTAQVLSAVSDTMEAQERSRAIRAECRAIEKTAKENVDYVYRVSEMLNGTQYYLFTYEQINDIRLVYAPPSAIGNYGGEADNWIWPRHTGDFSFLRAYVAPDGKPAQYSADNVPYRPRHFLPISARGFTDGSFAMILGFPGRTFRHREASAIQVQRDETLPTTIDLYKTRIDIIENTARTDRAIQIKYASRLRGLQNTYKKYLGVLEGMRRTDLMTIKRNQETGLTTFISSSPDRMMHYGHVLEDLAKANADLQTFNRKNILLTNLSTGVDILRLAIRFKNHAALFLRDAPDTTSPSADREPSALKGFIASVYKNLEPDIDKQTLVALILKSADMPVDQRVVAFRGIVGECAGADRKQAVWRFVEDLYDETALASQKGCEILLAGDPESITSDPFVRFAADIDAEIAAVQAKVAAYNASVDVLRQKFMEAWIAWKKVDPLYPDANRTLRFTYGVVKPLTPRDAVTFDYRTTLGGVIEKERDVLPFIVPPKLKELWLQKDFGPYADPARNDVPVAFIADLDITGGNSGSPVMNGRGELIGCAFDGNWESLVGDYRFLEPFNRTISVDARYILFILDKFAGAQNVLNELVIR